MINHRTAFALACSIAAAAFLAACSGASGGLVPSGSAEHVPSASARHGKIPVSFRIKIPRERKHRHGHYVSPSTGSFAIAVYDQTHTHLLASANDNTIPGIGGCSSVVNGQFTCTFAIAVAPGNDTFDVTAYDDSGGQGAQLSLILDQPFTVAIGKANQVALVLDGVPSTVGILLLGTSKLASGNQIAGFTLGGTGAPAAQQFQLVATDADGNQIVGTGLPVFGLASSDPTDLAIAPVSGSKDRFTLTPLHVTAVSALLTAAATPLEGGGATVIANASLTVSPILFVANSGGVGTDTIVAFAPWSTSPIYTIPASTGISNPFTMTVDKSGNLYVANTVLVDGTVLEFAPGSTVPSRTIGGLNGPDLGLAVDGSGDIFVTEAFGGGDVKEFTPAGGSTPSRTLSKTSSPTGIDVPAGLAVDAAGNLYVANNSGTIGIAVFAPGTSTTPTVTFDAGMSAPYTTLFDASGDLYVANYKGNNVTEYKPPFTSASVVHATFGAMASSPNPLALAIDGLGDVYAGLNNGSVVEFASGGSIVRTLSSVADSVASLAVDGSNNLYVPRDSSNSASIFAPGTSTTATTTYSTGLNDPVTVALWQ